MNIILAVYLVRNQARLAFFSQSIVLMMEKCSFTFEGEVNEDTCVIEIPHSIKSVSSSHQRPEQTSNMEPITGVWNRSHRKHSSCVQRQLSRTQGSRVCLSVCLFIYPSIYLSVRLSVCRFI